MVSIAGLTEAELDQGLRILARAAAPYVAGELRKSAPGHMAEEPLDVDYDDRTCAVFASELGRIVIERAFTLFENLDEPGRIDSLALAEKLDTTPRELSGMLTTPLKRRAAALGLPLPWEGGRGSEEY